MNTEPYAKEIEDALDRELKDLAPKINGGPVKPGNVTLAVELDSVIESLRDPHPAMETDQVRLEALKTTLLMAKPPKPVRTHNRKIPAYPQSG